MSKVKKRIKRDLPIIVMVIVLLITVITLVAACSNLAKGNDENVATEVQSTAPTTTVTTTVPTTTPAPTTVTTTPKPTTPVPTTPKPTTPKPTTAASAQNPTTVTTAAPPPQNLDDTSAATVKVTVSSVNVRSVAGTEGSILGSVGNGGKLEVVGSCTGSNDKKWYAVRYKGQIGYISAGCAERMTSGVGTVYLTFDDGPSKNTSKILDTLDSCGVKATFFVKYNRSYDTTYKKIVDRGNTIANHTYCHDYATVYKSDEAFFADLQKMEDYIKSTAGVTTKIIRFPGGSSNTVSKKYSKGLMSRLTKSVTEKGYVYFDWNVDSGDATATTVAKNTIINNIKNNLGTKSTAIILMHDASSKTTTAEALPEIIAYIRARGYDIQPLTMDSPVVHHSVNN